MTWKTQKIVAITTLKGAPHNPKGRTEAARIRSLRKSMEELGLIYPVLVDGDNQIIDGHRRVAAAKALGWKDISVVQIEGNAEHIYAQVNATAQKMNGNDALGIWLKNPEAVTPRAQKTFEGVEKSIGRKLLIRIYNEGHSIRMYRIAARIAAATGPRTAERILDIVVWLLEFKSFDAVEKILSTGSSVELILKAVKSKKPLKQTFAIAS